jgi:hypothetical protein
MFLCDATVDYSIRSGLVCIDSAGAKTDVSFDLGGGAEQLKPYVCEEYNNHLFVAGYENKTLSLDAPATLRHSYLGVSPEAAGGFDPLAYNYIGAKGQRITGLKKGRGLLLVAKANELHRVSGYGIAKPGWTFAVEPVESTQGMGVANPYALCYAGGEEKGYWYGIGESGPFRSDGFSAESLVSVRRRSWKKITNLAYSWVQYHPDRDCVLFGFNQTPAPVGRSATYPTIMWVWDCQREVWMTDITMSADVMYAHAIPTGTVLGPTAIPSGLAFAHGSATLTTVAASWVNGDATADTQLWLRDITHGGPFLLWATAVPGATTATLGSLAAGVNYSVQIRHVKSSVASGYTAEVSAYTLLPAPVLTYNTFYGYLESAVAIGHGTVRFENTGVEYDVTTVTAPGTYIAHGAPGTHVYRSRCIDVAWPAAIQNSQYSNNVLVTI